MAIPLHCFYKTFPGNESEHWRFFSFRCPRVNTPKLNPQLLTINWPLESSRYMPRADPTENTAFYWPVFTDPLPSNISPSVAHVGFRGNVFTESLPSNGSIRHNINSSAEFIIGLLETSLRSDKLTPLPLTSYVMKLSYEDPDTFYTHLGPLQ
jgi:hypothetical protein